MTSNKNLFPHTYKPHRLRGPISVRTTKENDSSIGPRKPGKRNDNSHRHIYTRATTLNGSSQHTTKSVVERSV